MSIILENLVKRFGYHVVVDRVSLEIREGELLVLLGPSGSGKSTILRMIAGLVPVDDGRVKLEGREVTDLPPQERSVGFVFQSYALFPHMTVAENVEFGLAVRKVPKAERAARRDELLALVGLAGFGGRDVRRMSGGQQQRVAVARALAHEPSVLLLDEPFGALDVQIRGQLRRALKDLQRRVGVTTILVTHDQEEAFELADRIGVVDHGRLLEVGEPEALYRSPRHEFVAGFLGEANLFGARPQGDRLVFGSLTPSLPEADEQAPGRWAVLVRPEDVALAPQGIPLDVPRLATGRIEEVLVLGGQRRLRLRLEPIPGAWPLGRGYSAGSGVPLVATVAANSGSDHAFRPGAIVEVGVQRLHVLPRVALRVLVLADGSPEVGPALAAAGRVIQALGGRLTILSVAPDASAGQRLMAALQDQLSATLPGAALESRHGDPAREVLREAQGQRYDLVVLPGWSGASATGDDRREAALEIARRSAAPVLIAREGAERFRRVLLCTAAGEAGKEDILLGGRLARATGAEATLFHVGSPTDSAGSHDWVQRHLSEGAETLRAQGTRVEARFGSGDVVETIVSEAAHGEYDLIVVGGHQRGSRVREPERDLATEILTRTDRSVLVVNSTQDD
jgi:sulfate transport system ATP-binding protein